jgi:hypothetical protein
MITSTQAADCTLPNAGEPEVIAVTTASVTHTLVGLGGKWSTTDLGRVWRWLADGAKVYAVFGGAPTLSSVSESGTTPPDVTLAGTPTFGGTLLLEVNATTGDIAGTTFDLTVGGVLVAEELEPTGNTLELPGTGLTATLSYPTRGAVTGNGTTPPVMTSGGNSLVVGNIRVDVDSAGAGTFTAATFTYKIDAGPDIACTKDGTTLVLGSTGLTATFAAGTFNANNYWTFTVTGYNADNAYTATAALTADETATSGATVPMVFSDGVAADYGMSSELVEQYLAGRIKTIAVAVKGASATKLRCWPASSKVNR